MMPWCRNVLLLFLAVVACAYAKPPIRAIEDFTLTNDRGERWSWQQARGKVALVAFGYTSCPDICPTTLTVVSQTLRQLGENAERVQALFITVDGEHDRPEVLNEYIRHFDRRIVGLTGSPGEIDQATQRFNVSYEIKRSESTENYTIDHTANLYVVAPDGVVTALVPLGFPADHIVRLIRTQLNR